MKNRRLIILVVLLLVIGFAAVSTTLYINGQTNILANAKDFDVYFSEAILDEEDVSGDVISTDGRTITYKTNELKAINQKSELVYEITNNSSQYDAEVTIECIMGETDKLTYNNTFTTDIIRAKTTANGTLTVELKKAALEDEEVELKCVLDVNAVERDTVGEEEIPEGEASTYSIYGYFKDEEGNLVTNENLVVYSETPHYVTTDNRGYFYVDGLETGTHEIYYVGTKKMEGTTKEEVKKEAIDQVELTTSTKKIKFEDGSKITESVIEKTNNKDLSLSFDVDGGEKIENQVVTQNSKYGDLPTPEKEGYTFEKWVYEDGSEVLEDTIIPTGTNHTITAVYEEHRYTIDYNSNGGVGMMESTTQKYSTELKLTKNTFTKSGYDFIGWNTKSDGSGKSYSDEELVSGLFGENNGRITLYAKWSANAYKVTLDGNGGSVEKSEITVEYNGVYGELETPVREGYTFLGWYLDDTLVESTTKVTTSEPHTLIAKWSAKEYLVILNPNGGTLENDEITVNYDSTYGTLPTPTRTGYTFNGWYTAIDGGEKIESTTIVKLTNTQNLYVKWTAKEYTIIYDAAGGSVSETNKKVTYDSTYGELKTPTRTGYTFNGWYLGSILIENTTKVEITSDSTITAKWTVNTYKVTFNADGGSVSEASRTVTYDSTYGTLPTPSKTGYTFKGWYINDALIEGTTKVKVTSDSEIKAKWTINKYTLTVNPNGGIYNSGTDTVTYEMNYNSTKEISNPTRDGYTFTGWDITGTNATLNGKEFKIGESNATLKATWTINDYAYIVKHYQQNVDGNGYTLVDADTVNKTLTYGEKVTPSVKTYTGFTSPSTQTLTISSDTSKNVVEYKYTRNQYTLTINTNNGTSNTSEKMYYGATKTIANPSKTGYTFTNWSVTGTGSTIASGTFKMGTANTTLTANYSANKYTLKFNANSGTVSETSRSVIYGSAVGELPTPTRTGYTFSGWYTATSGGTKYESTTVVSFTTETTLYAQWTANKYTLKFNANGGSVAETSRSVTYDSAVGELPTPTRTGYTFNGWYTQASGGTKYESTTKVTFTSETILYARWTANVYTLKFNANGGSVSEASRSVTYGSAVGELPEPTRTGYTFQGWYTATSGGTKYESTTIVSFTSEITLYAQWSAITYTVKYNGNGNTGGSTASSIHTYDVSKTLTENGFTKSYAITFNANGGNVSTTSATASYTFSGWATSSTGSVVHTDKKSVTNLSTTNGATVNLYAQWTGGTLSSLPTPTREGYTFNGWYTSLTGGTKITTSTVITSAQTLYAQWTVNSYILKFNANNGSVSETSRSVTYGSAVGELPIPIRTGYTFNGWYTAISGGTKYESTTVVSFTTETTLYASWDIIVNIPTIPVVPSSFSIGKEVSIGAEKFNIISTTNDTITMLSQLNLDETYKQTETQMRDGFADTYDWEYTPGPKEIDIQSYDGEAKTYVNEYVEYLQQETGITGITGDLITLAQLKTLGCKINSDYSYVSGLTCANSSYASWLVNGQYWWTRSAISTEVYKNAAWVVVADGGLFYGGKYQYAGSGIRPIITVSKNFK